MSLIISSRFSVVFCLRTFRLVMAEETVPVVATAAEVPTDDLIARLHHMSAQEMVDWYQTTTAVIWKSRELPSFSARAKGAATATADSWQQLTQLLREKSLKLFPQILKFQMEKFLNCLKVNEIVESDFEISLDYEQQKETRVSFAHVTPYFNLSWDLSCLFRISGSGWILGCLDASLVARTDWSSSQPVLCSICIEMDTTVFFDYKDLVPNGTGILELKCKLNSLLDSEIDEWKRSLQDRMIFDHELRVLRRHFQLEMFMETSNTWERVSYDSTIPECLSRFQCSLRKEKYFFKVKLNHDRTLANCGVP